ncbi:type I glyceraldehyde-3-phosphate dehydrogenase [Nitrosophilus kaiyonis]|uniref:type I glyceraldehyde-3-phosphate dehydrogenase n=1 Tax=Nitrosophilus kaiyonis TaxID=2930200 RepID=UPI0024930019|nr:type I glyceraldehyde-3-phosphate dehydrogenase [Nitrosophilus kaiyonis]
MGINVAINGFGRIGRALARNILNDNTLNLIAINDIMPVQNAAYLLHYDSVHSKFNEKVDFDDKNLYINDKKIKFFNEKDPKNLHFEADIVFECSGLFLSKLDTKHHLEKNAKKVIISAPANDDTPTYVLGVNHNEYKGENIISNASCTTNCLAPIAKILDKHFGIEKGFITTVHSYTYDQNLLDNSHRKDLRRSRAAAINLIPTTTGAAKAIDKVLPNLRGKLDGRSVRVPVADVSLLDFDVVLSKKTTKDEINELFLHYSQNELKGILGIDEEFRVSQDFINDSHSCIVALDLTQIIDGNFVKIMSWYDNEWGYANRLVDMAKYISIKS